MATKPSTSRDDVLIDEYVAIKEKSSEAIIRDPTLSSELRKRVNRRLPTAERFAQVDLSKRLETLRKTGKLPKKFRAFNGRDMTKAKPK